jgi:hypothetical protein
MPVLKIAVTEMLALVMMLLLLMQCDEGEDVNNQKPVIDILSPQPEAIVETAFTAQAEVNTKDGIKKVAWYMNGVLLGYADQPPHAFSIDIKSYATGPYTLKAVAYDHSGKYGSKQIVINIVRLMSAPTNFLVSKGTLAKQIKLTWDKVTGASSYQVFKLEKSTNTYVNVATVTEPLFIDNNIAGPAIQYFYKIRAFNSDKAYGYFTDSDYGYSNGYELITSFGKQGAAVDEFTFNIHMNYHANELFIADEYKIVRYDKQGNFLGLFSNSGVGEAKAPIFFDNDVSWNVFGTNIFIKQGSTILKTISTRNNIQQLTIDNNNFVLGSAYDRVYKFGTDGNLIAEFIVGDVDFKAWGIAFLNGHIVLSSREGNAIRFYSENGQFVKQWRLKDERFVYDLYVKDNYLYVASGTCIAKTDFEGLNVEKIYGAFSNATGVIVDEDQNIIVTDPSKRKIYVYKKSN